MENASTTKNDETLRLEFAEMVNACEKCAREACLPWQLATALLTALLAVLLWHK